jgi:hypothetical protein
MTILPSDRSSLAKSEIATFIDGLKATQPATGQGSAARLIFAIDATGSRQPTWDRACTIQGEMFEATMGLGGLSVQLVYFRGFNECRASKWLSTAGDLHRVMRGVSCVGGETQIERVLDHAIHETGKAKVGAVIFIGDAAEEKVDRLCGRAGMLGERSVPIFCFHEGDDAVAAAAFRQMSALSGGAYLAFDLAGIARLKELLAAVAVFAIGGHAALTAHGAKKGGEVLRLAQQLHR